nr:MAG TPA: hypothetical protein [Caudoviricetes sp.]DAO50064.1 MAG TPA: hypothetical protein [Caudoviricetes sp.]DAP04063.1 MAG TPA: hypothetical protein [Caudoviricetes sp.]
MGRGVDIPLINELITLIYPDIKLIINFQIKKLL